MHFLLQHNTEGSVPAHTSGKTITVLKYFQKVVGNMEHGMQNQKGTRTYNIGLPFH